MDGAALPPPWGPEVVAGSKRRPPAFWPWLLLLLGGAGVAAGIGWEVWPHLPALPGLQVQAPESAPPPAVKAQRRVRLFFPETGRAALREQERDIPRGTGLAEDARALLQALATGGEPGVHPPLPPGVKLQQVYVDAFGILYLDFNRPFQDFVTNETGPQVDLAILAIVGTFTSSFSEIKRVQFMSDGQELAMTVGSLDLRRPLSPDFPGEASAGGAPQPSQ